MQNMCHIIGHIYLLDRFLYLAGMYFLHFLFWISHKLSIIIRYPLTFSNIWKYWQESPFFTLHPFVLFSQAIIYLSQMLTMQHTIFAHPKHTIIHTCFCTSVHSINVNGNLSIFDDTQIKYVCTIPHLSWWQLQHNHLKSY